MSTPQKGEKKRLETELRAIDPELKELYSIYKYHYFRYKHALDKKKLPTIDRW